jgi:hypothetical protein
VYKRQILKPKTEAPEAKSAAPVKENKNEVVEFEMIIER